MRQRRETESCESCLEYIMQNCEYGYGVCTEDSIQVVSVDENDWCSKYKYDGVPCCYLKVEDFHVDRQ